MKAFIGRLHLLGNVAIAELEVPELWLLLFLLYNEEEEVCGDTQSLPFDRSGSGLLAPPLDNEALRWRAILLNTYTADESNGVKS